MPRSKLFSFEWSGKAVGVNDRYADRRSKRLSPEYAAFKSLIRWASCDGMGHSKPPITAPVWLCITMYIDKARDSDSLLKPLFDGMEWDAFTKIGMLKNDNQIKPYFVMPHAKIRGSDDLITVSAYPWAGNLSDILEVLNG